MKEILLTQDKVALVNDEDFEWLNQWKWYAQKHRSTYYARRMSLTINRKRHMIQMHHEIIGYPPKGLVTDHRDGDGRNNQRNNLRHITFRQNNQNLKNIIKSSKYPGVRQSKRNKPWRADIKINGKGKWLGYFKTEIEAFSVYRQAVECLGQIVIDHD